MFTFIINELISNGLYQDIGHSLGRVLIGFTIASIAAITIALLLNEFKVLRIILCPIIETLRPIPNAGWIPIAIIMFRTVEESTLFITFIGSFFPIFTNVFNGLKELPQSYKDFVILLHINRFEKMFHVFLPGIIQHVFTGLMSGMSGAWLSLIMAEMMNGKSGIGYYTWKNYTLLNYDKVIFGVIIMGCLGAMSSLFISTIAHKQLHWMRRGIF